MLRRAIETSALVLILAHALGCGSSSNPASPDGGVDGSTGDTGVAGDASGEGGDAGPDCGAMPPSGTQLVAATDPLVIFKLTDDDHAVYENLTTQELYAVPIAGGASSDIGKMTSQGGTVWTHGPTVLWLPSAADPQTSIAPLSAWSAASGNATMTPNAVAVDSYYYTYDASKDGKYVAYYVTTNARTATLMVSTIDGKTQTPLVPEVDLTDQNCFPPAVQFVNDTLIAQYCVIPTVFDGGAVTETQTVATFTGPSFTPTVTLGSTFTPSQGPVTVDPTGTLALLPGTAGAGGIFIYPLAGGSPTLVDAKGANGFFASNGDVIYTNTSSALLRWVASTSTATTLVTSGLQIPYDVSPDGQWLQAADKQDSTGQLSDLYIASATTPGPLTTVVSTATASPQGFTLDSNYSVFGTGFPSDFGAVTYSLEASKSSGGAPVKVLSAAAGALFTSGAKLVSNTNQSKTTGAADIVSVDLSSTAAPTTLVTQADPNLFLSTTTQVVYSWYCDENGKAGIWALTPP